MRAGQGYSDSMAAPATAVPDLVTDKPPRSRRWIPVSVRLVFMFGIVGFTWLAVRSYGNAITINAIERLGGKVSMRPGTPQWLRRPEFGDWTKLLDDVISVRIAFAEI